MHGALVELPTLRDVAGGFDLSELAARYRWWPGALMRTDLRGGAPFAMLSAPFCLLELDLQGVVDAAVPLPGEEDNVFCSDEDGSSSSGSGGGKPLQCAWEYDELVDVGVTGSGTWNAVVVWFGIGQELGAPAALLSWAAPQQAAAVAGECEGRQAEAQAVAWSWGQGLQHVDGTAVHKASWRGEKCIIQHSCFRSFIHLLDLLFC